MSIPNVENPGMQRFIQKVTNLLIISTVFLWIFIHLETIRNFFKPASNLYDLRKVNLAMFGYDLSLADTEVTFSNRHIVETEYPQLNGKYFSPFATNKSRTEYETDPNSKKIVCWYEGLCYEYFKPAIEKNPDENFRKNQCENMLKHGKWNISPYPMYFRGAVSWNGNTSFQWDTEGCTQRVYYWREARRCLKKQTLYFLGGHRSRQMYLALKAMINDTLVFDDPGGVDFYPDLSSKVNVQVGVDDSISQMFVNLEHRYLEEKSTGSAANVAPQIIQNPSARKIVVINPNESFNSKTHFQHITAIIKMLCADKFIKYILVFAVETAPGSDKDSITKFNEQLEKFIPTLKLSYVKFIKVNLLSGINMVQHLKNGAYMKWKDSSLIVPNLRVNLNIMLNYICNNDGSIQNMKSADTNCCV